MLHWPTGVVEPPHTIHKLGSSHPLGTSSIQGDPFQAQFESDAVFIRPSVAEPNLKSWLREIKHHSRG
jgi:hypothetical protein